MWGTVIAAFAVAILSGLGVGSAGLFVLWLTFFEGVSQLTAQGLNLMFFLFSSGAALTVHLYRTKIPGGCVLLLLLGGIPAALLGSALANAIDEGVLRTLFGVLLIAAGAMGLLRRSKRQKKEKSRRRLYNKK